MTRITTCDGCGREVTKGSIIWFESTPDGGLFGHYICLAPALHDNETETEHG